MANAKWREVQEAKNMFNNQLNEQNKTNRFHERSLS